MTGLVPEAKYNPDNLRSAKASAWRIYARLIRYSWQYKGRLIVSLLFALVVAVSFSSMILLAGGAIRVLYADEATVDGYVDQAARHLSSRLEHIEGILGKTDPVAVNEKLQAFVGAARAHKTRTLAYLCGVLVSVAFIGGLARYIQEYFAGAIGASISVELAREMFENIMRLSLPFFEKHAAGEILARFTNDVFQVNRGLAAVFVKLFREPIKAVFFLAIAFGVDWKLTLTVLVVLPLIAYTIVAVGRKVKKSFRWSLQKIGSMASVAGETFKGIVIVKAYCMEAYETARVRVELGKLEKYLRRTVRADAAIGPLTEFLMVVGLAIFILLASRAVEGGRLDVGDLFNLFAALAAMMDPVRKLTVVNNMIQASVASAERVFEYIDMKPDFVEAPDAVELPPLRDRLRFENVRFSYDGQMDVLEDLTFEVKKGELVALVGFSGAGKSTIVKLIPRFYDATSGAVTIDGVDVRRATFESLRDQIGIVTQDTILFNESVRSNIAFGREIYSDERVRQAAGAAHASEFIEKLPEGYDTVLGESGGTLSGGQRQRLAIARAVIKDPAILILDEATSSLDSESEQAIQAAIAEFVVGRTAIVIAHRLSTIQRADRILVVDRGRIVEEGTHRELMAQNGLYRRLYDVQFAAAAAGKDAT